MSRKIILSVLILLPIINSCIGLCEKGEKCQPLPAVPGCNRRPNCTIDGTDKPCDPATVFPDSCWCNAYYECSHGAPVPFICPEGTLVNPAATGLNVTALPGTVAVCDWPTETCDTSNCGCDPSCAIPPECPDPNAETTTLEPSTSTVEWREKRDVSSCTGAIVLPHACDCQFYWTCRDGIPILSVCGAGFYFQPDGTTAYGGSCAAVGDVSIPESVACLPSSKEKAAMLTQQKLKAQLQLQPALLAPAVPKRRHPLIALLMAQGVPIPSYLQRYISI